MTADHYEIISWEYNKKKVLFSKKAYGNATYYINPTEDEFELIMKDPITEDLDLINTFSTVSMAKLEAEICNFSNAQKNNRVDKKIILELDNKVNKNEDVDALSLWLKSFIYVNNYQIIINKCAEELNFKSGNLMLSPITGNILGKITEIH